MTLGFFEKRKSDESSSSLDQENNSSLLKVSWPQNNKQERRAVKGVCANNKDEFKLKWDYNLLQLCLKINVGLESRFFIKTFRKTDETIRILKSVAIQRCAGAQKFKFKFDWIVVFSFLGSLLYFNMFSQFLGRTSYMQ